MVFFIIKKSFVLWYKCIYKAIPHTDQKNVKNDQNHHNTLFWLFSAKSLKQGRAIK